MDPQRKRLFDMEIDEISLVDRGANQHAAIVISKALDSEEEHMPEVELYDAEGEAIESLEDGDVVYDVDGNEYVYTQDGTEEYEGDGEYAYAGGGYEDDDEVGKGFNPVGSVKAFGQGLRGAEHSAGKANQYGRNVRNFYRTPGGGYNKARVGLTAAGVGGTGAVGYGAMRKSLGDVVMEELSKAASEDERSEVIAKAMEEVEIAKAQAEEAWNRVAAQDDAMLESAFISKAAEYNLPVDPIDFGQILKAASTVLDYEQLDLLDQLFNSVGEALYEEVGYIGDTDNNSVLDMVNGYVGELVGKSDYSPEELSTAVFEANPDAYDAYLAENR